MTFTAAARSDVPESVTSTGGDRYVADVYYPIGGRTETKDSTSRWIFGDPGTAASPRRILWTDGTSASSSNGTLVPARQTTGEAVLEIRRRSGLTWELLSEIFNVSRRTVYQWASGKSPSAQHESAIRRTLDAIRHVDEGSRQATRDRLMMVTHGLSLFDLLAEGRFVDVLRQPEGAASMAADRHRTTLSEDELARYRPPPAVLLLDAIQDRPDIPVTRARIVHPMGRKKKLSE